MREGAVENEMYTIEATQMNGVCIIFARPHVFEELPHNLIAVVKASDVQTLQAAPAGHLVAGVAQKVSAP